MKTIPAKQLRDELGDIVRRVHRGERFRVLYRSKPAFVIQPVEERSRQPEPGSKEAMRSFIREVRRMHAEDPRPSVFDPNKSIKELYHELLDADPKYRRYRGRR